MILRNDRSASRTMLNTAEKDDPVREGDDLFEVVVCELRESPLASTGP